ncbi:hypothetical protein ASE09_06525 [Streptomyces sp. Root66D1]|nr:hypothetical protein ASD33_06520 [Streptomyces sp. Root1304]KRA90592.1 hypothetical protein ASE09_06525 [Streptomyces sp. Root66D1]
MARGAATAPARPTGVPAQPSPAPGAVPPGGRGAWAVGRERLRVAATTEPGRLQILGAVLAVLLVAFGAVTAFQVDDRAGAADDVVHRSQPLSGDAAAIYRYLADADTTAASGFLAGTLEPEESRKRYDRDIAAAARLLVEAAAGTDGSGQSAAEIATLNEQLPRYTGLVERARAANRQGLPLGGAYLRYANQQMTSTLLPAAERLYTAETERLRKDDAAARTWPYLSVAVGLVVLAALGWAQRRNYVRTHRVFNHGLLAATAATVVALLWLATAHTLARADLNKAQAHGQESLQVLNTARISSLTARANENLTLVARGAVLTEDRTKDKYEADYAASMEALTGALADAGELADDAAGRTPVDEAVNRVRTWQTLHKEARAKDEGGDYEGALTRIVGPKDSTGQAFDQVDAALERALAHEKAEFTRSAEDAGAALTALPLGAAALGILGAAGAVLGINRRLSEYR